MKGMRNIIAHDYGEVDLVQVWQTARTDIPAMIKILDEYFDGCDRPPFPAP
jgi:uncharacterized protein with HEPN domain